MSINLSYILPQMLYVFLVAAIWLAALALVSPGTGVLELLTFLTLVIVGVGTIWVPLNGWALGIIALGIICFVLSLRGKQTEVWLVLAALAFVTGSVFLFRGGSWGAAVSPVLAVPVSLLTIGYFWIAIRKVLIAHSATPTMDLSHLIGAVGEARTRLDPSGSVYVHGELWTAESNNPIEAGQAVRVISRDQLLLEVEPVVDHQEE